MTIVSIYKPQNTGTYDGKGSSTRYFTREFEDRETAERWAKDQVEAHGALYAKVVTR